MSKEYTPKDIRYLDKVSGQNKRSVASKKAIKIKTIKRERRERVQKKESDDRWSRYISPSQKLNMELQEAKVVTADFMKRTGRILNLSNIHYHMSRRELTVMDVITKDLGKPKSWLTLSWTPGHKRMLNQKELRYVCVKLQVKHWREMRTREMMAVLLVLSWMDGIDLKQDEILGDS